MPAERVPDGRIRGNGKAIRPDGRYVLYWMTGARRTRFNFGLQRAVELGEELGRPLVVFEALRCGYPWACDRFHRFVLDGMDERQGAGNLPYRYVSYVEPEPGAGHGLLARLAGDACAIVTDDSPAFFLPRMLHAAEARVSVRFERVDSNGLLPMRATRRVFTTAFSFRRFLHDALPEHLEAGPRPDPFEGARLPGPPELESGWAERWPGIDRPIAAIDLATLPIDHAVPASPIRGGPSAAERRLEAFLKGSLSQYADGRSHPDDDHSSRLSPYLHFGHVAAHEIFRRVVEREGWTIEALGEPTGKRRGWWGLSAGAESFLDELVTWREIGLNRCALRADHAEYESLPDWARETLAEHADDPRPKLYDLETLEAAETGDDVWNAAQTELVREGRLHNYLRMLWGKKILEWSPSPREALGRMIHLNDKYAIDGRDPNSYSGIFWVLGRYDRAWGPERPIFGKIRYMSSKSTVRKLRLQEYLERYGAGVEQLTF